MGWVGFTVGAVEGGERPDQEILETEGYDVVEKEGSADQESLEEEDRDLGEEDVVGGGRGVEEGVG